MYTYINISEEMARNGRQPIPIYKCYTSSLAIHYIIIHQCFITLFSPQHTLNGLPKHFSELAIHTHSCPNHSSLLLTFSTVIFQGHGYYIRFLVLIYFLKSHFIINLACCWLLFLFSRGVIFSIVNKTDEMKSLNDWYLA